MVDYLFWLNDASERLAINYASQAKKKLKGAIMMASGFVITDDFTLIDYNPDKYDALVETRRVASEQYVHNNPDEFEAGCRKLKVGTRKGKDPLELYVEEQEEKFKEENPDLIQEIPVKKGTVGVLVRCTGPGLELVKKYFKYERITYDRITEWTNDNYLPPKYVKQLY